MGRKIQPGWPRVTRFGAALLQQGFVLFPVLGAGAFLLRKFLGLEPNDDSLPQRLPSALWRNTALGFAALALVILTTFALEVLLWPRTAGWLRAGAILVYLASSTPCFARRGGFLGNALRVGLASVVLAPVWLALDPFRASRPGLSCAPRGTGLS